MNNILLATIKESWELIVIIVGGGVSTIKYFRDKKIEKSSAGILYEELERLKIKVITQVQKDIQNATKLSEKEIIILEFKKNCPDCYQQVFEKINTTKNEPTSKKDTKRN